MRFVVCVRTPVCPFEELYSVHNDSKCCPDQKIVLHTCITENLHMLTCFLCVFLSLNKDGVFFFGFEQCFIKTL